VGQEVAQEVHPATLPRAALEHALDRGRQPQVGIRDHQPGAGEATLFERTQELAPEALRFAIAYGDAERLAVAQGIDADRHHHRTGADLQVAAQAVMEIGGVEVDVGEAGMVERPTQKGFHLLVKALADAAHLRFGDAAGPAQGLHQGVDHPRGDAAGGGLHHHGVEGLVDPATRLEPVGEEAALPQVGDSQAENAHLGGKQPLAVAVAVGGALIRAALMARGTNGRGDLSLQ